MPGRSYLLKEFCQAWIHRVEVLLFSFMLSGCDPSCSCNSDEAQDEQFEDKSSQASTDITGTQQSRLASINCDCNTPGVPKNSKESFYDFRTSVGCIGRWNKRSLQPENSQWNLPTIQSWYTSAAPWSSGHFCQGIHWETVKDKSTWPWESGTIEADQGMTRSTNIQWLSND